MIHQDVGGTWLLFLPDGRDDDDDDDKMEMIGGTSDAAAAVVVVACTSVILLTRGLAPPVLERVGAERVFTLQRYVTAEVTVAADTAGSPDLTPALDTFRKLLHHMLVCARVLQLEAT